MDARGRGAGGGHGPDQRWAVLGGLRFGLAWIVLIGHAQYNAPTSYWMASLAQLGSFAAVLGFFAVSGYSIAHSYHQKPSDFFARRVRRLYPAYFVAFLLSLVPLYLLTTDLHIYGTPPLDLPTSAQFVANSLCLQGLTAPALSSNRPFWSLGAEVGYYALTPIFFRLRSRVLVVLMLASALLYLMHSLGFLPFDADRYPNQGDGIAAACLLCVWLGGLLLWRHPDAEWPRWLLVGGGCVLLGYDDTQHCRFSVAVFLAASLLVVYARRIRVPIRLAPWLSYLGDLSYPLYLVHYPLLLILHNWCHVSAAAPLLLAPMAAAVLLHHGVELPVRRRGARAVAAAGNP